MTSRNRRTRRRVPPTARTFAEWLPFWENELGARGVREATQRNQREGLRKLAAFIAITAEDDADAAKVSDTDLIRWRDALQARGLKPASVNRYLLTVGTFYNWLAAEDVIPESPMLYVPLLPVGHETAPPVLNADQLKRMAKGAGSMRKGRSRFESVRDPAILALLRDTGLRASECAGLLVDHVDLGARQALVHGDVAKGGRPRTVTFGFQTARLLNRYLLARESHAFAFLPQLFLGRKGAATYTIVWDLVRKAGKSEGVTGARPHLLRHTWAHDLKAQGAELEVLMSLGGWTTTSMPMRYGRAEKSARAVAAYQRMGSPVDRANAKR